MNPPINLPGCACIVKYPAAIYGLERFEQVAYERFASNAFRESVQGLARRNLPIQLTVNFEESLNLPAWAINCSVSSSGTPRNRFTIHVPELLPATLALMTHTLGSVFGDPSAARKIKSEIQTLANFLSTMAGTYQREGLGSAIRAGFEAAGLSHYALQESVDLLDTLIYQIVNHEIGHIYIEQLTRTENRSDAKASEFLADLISAEWLFRRYIFQTPDDSRYRKDRGFDTHAEAILSNAKWCFDTLALIYILMGLGGAQQSNGKFEVAGGRVHPGAFNRYKLQGDWVMGAVEAQLNDLLGEKGVKELSGYRISRSEILIDSGLADRSAMAQVFDEEEAKALVRAGDIAVERKIEEILLGFDFLRGSVERAAQMRTRLRSGPENSME